MLPAVNNRKGIAMQVSSIFEAIDEVWLSRQFALWCEEQHHEPEEKFGTIAGAYRAFQQTVIAAIKEAVNKPEMTEAAAANGH